MFLRCSQKVWVWYNLTANIVTLKAQKHSWCEKISVNKQASQQFASKKNDALPENPIHKSKQSNCVLLLFFFLVFYMNRITISLGLFVFIVISLFCFYNLISSTDLRNQPLYLYWCLAVFTFIQAVHSFTVWEATLAQFSFLPRWPENWKMHFISLNCQAARLFCYELLSLGCI